MEKDIFSEVPKMQYQELAFGPDNSKDKLAAFKEVVNTRRSVRVFEPVPIPEAVIQDCIDQAIKAPNSSNLQPWEFHWIKSPEIKAKIVKACLSQPAASTAAELIVAVARIGTWKRNSAQMLELLMSTESQGLRIPSSVKHYYQKLVPMAYTQGMFGEIGLLKKAMLFLVGLKKPIPREPTSLSQMKIWAVKTVSLACENLMLAIRAHGYDSCPMEGFDSVRVRKALSLPSDAQVVMVIGMGKRAKNGVYGPQLRLERNQFVFIR